MAIGQIDSQGQKLFGRPESLPTKIGQRTALPQRQPPNRVVVTWQINGMWQYDDDPDRASEIEVRFTDDGPEQTTVELEHRYLDRLIAGQAIHHTIGQGGGWLAILEAFGKAAEASRA